MKENILKNARLHTFNELEFPNIVISIEDNFEAIQKAHDSIHEFLYLASICLPKNKSWYEKSAFLCYSWDIFYSAHRSLLEALAGYYNVAFSLLRNVLELTIKGALWECLAHKKFRQRELVLKKHKVKFGESIRPLIDWLEDIIKQKPEIEKELEKTSGGIFDKLAPIFNNKDLEKLIPSNKKIIEQLIEWKIFEPIPKPNDLIYEKIYRDLCKDVHVIPDRTDIGRRLLGQKDLFEVRIILEELEKYLKILHEVIDIAIVVELNILSDWITQNDEARDKLIERLSILNNLGLKFSNERLKFLVKKNAN